MNLQLGLRRLLLVWPIVCSHAVVASADSAIALTGDPAPGSGGGTFFVVHEPDMNDAGQVTFRSTIDGGTATQGVFVDPGTGVLAIAVDGDTAPDSGGATFLTFGDPVIDDSNAIVFSASLSGGTASWGLFSYLSGTITTIANTLTTAPGTSGGTYLAFGSKVASNDSGEVAFVANVSGGSVAEGLFVEGGGPGRAVILIGDAAPAGIDGTYFDLGPPAIDDSGNVAVAATFFDAPATFTSAVVVDEPGGVRAVARVGDPAPGTGSGTYESFSSMGAPGLDASGRVYFKATVTGGTSVDGIFVDDAGTDSAIALRFGSAPGAGAGALFDFFSTSGLPTTDSGDVGFSATLLSGTTSQGLFVARAGGPVAAVTVLSDPVPDVPTASFQTLGLGNSPVTNASGQAVFRAFYLDPGSKTGIFLVPEPTSTATAVSALLTLIALSRRRASATRRDRRGLLPAAAVCRE